MRTTILEIQRDRELIIYRFIKITEAYDMYRFKGDRWDFIDNVCSNTYESYKSNALNAYKG